MPVVGLYVVLAFVFPLSGSEAVTGWSDERPSTSGVAGGRVRNAAQKSGRQRTEWGSLPAVERPLCYTGHGGGLESGYDRLRSFVPATLSPSMPRRAAPGTGV